MKKTILTALAALFASAAVLPAQSFQQGLFLSNYAHGYRLNPAIQNVDNVLSIGEFTNRSRANVGAASFLYPREEGLVTALHSSVSADEFLGSLQDDSYLAGNINYNLVSYGWRSDKNYHTLEANVRALYSASVPKELFTLLKKGTAGSPLDAGGLGFGGSAYAELAYGFSRKLSDVVSIGFRAKLLVGIESLSFDVSRLDLTMNETVYRADIQSQVNLTSTSSKIKADENGYLNLLNTSAKDKWRLPPGAGLSGDFGILITPCEGFSISLSALDFGALLWYYGNSGVGEGSIEFDGLKDLSIEQIQDGKIAGQFAPLKDQLLETLKFKELTGNTVMELVPCELNAAAKFEMPFYRPLAIGASGSYFLQSAMSCWEARGVLAFNPTERFGIVASGGYGIYGPVWGVALTVGTGRFSLNAGFSNGVGGTIPYTSTPLKPNDKVLTVGLTCRL